MAGLPFILLDRYQIVSQEFGNVINAKVLYDDPDNNYPAFDLTGYTVTVELGDYDHNILDSQIVATIDTAASGTCHFAWASTDVPPEKVGLAYIRFRLEKTNVKAYTKWQRINVIGTHTDNSWGNYDYNTFPYNYP